MIVLALCLPAIAQHGSTDVVNPYTGPEHAQAGARLYRAQCAGCHGPAGAGTATGPNLTSGNFQRGGSDEALFQTIRNGVPGTAMPAFPLTGLETWQLVTHLRTLVIARSGSYARGNTQRGARVFDAHCRVCHTVSGNGGVTGPDLTFVGSRRSPAELRKALTDPSGDVPSEYWSVAIRARSGQQFRGIRLNEDTHSLQLREEGGRLLSVLKRDIVEFELIRRSPMPSFAGKLSEAEIDGVIAFLTTLRSTK